MDEKNLKIEEMSNYTDKFFEFPIMVVDGFEARRAEIMEDRDMGMMPDNASPVEAPWVEGKQLCLAEDIIGLSETFTKNRTVEKVKAKGFNLTLVETSTLGGVVSTWPLTRFKEELNKFMEQRKAKTESEKNTDSVQKPTIVYLVKGEGGETNYPL